MTMASEILSSNATRAEQIETRCSIEYAAELEAIFRQTYPPVVDYDEYYSSLSDNKATEAITAYVKVVETFDKGVEFMDVPTLTPGISRWHLVIDKMMDAIAVVVEKNAEDAFLTTTGEIGRDQRLLLSKICLTAAQCKDKILDNAAHVAWAKAAVAADPTYFNAHNILGLGYSNGGNFEKALEATEKANTLLMAFQEDLGDRATTLPERLIWLRKIVNNDCKALRKWITKDRINTPLSLWHEMSMERPEKCCDFCLWPGTMKCARCKTTYYCSRECQRFDHPAHKCVCIALSNK
jgi:hypothetical protein